MNSSSRTVTTVIFGGCEGHVFCRAHNWSLDLKLKLKTPSSKQNVLIACI